MSHHRNQFWKPPAGVTCAIDRGNDKIRLARAQRAKAYDAVRTPAPQQPATQPKR